VSTLQTEEAQKPELSPVPIWRCQSKECKAWIRDELNASDSNPDCPLCRGNMIRGIKHLPKLVKKHQSPKKKPAENAWLH
jgi:hypothetical protein